MLSREQLSTATAWGLDAAVSLKLTIPSADRAPGRVHVEHEALRCVTDLGPCNQIAVHRHLA